MRALRYAFDEAFASLWRGRQSGLLSTATIALALFVLGGFLLVTANLERLGAEWSSAAELSVYLNDDVDAGRAARRSKRVLAPGDVVAAHEYVSKAEALARFKQTFADLAAAVDGARRQPAAGVATRCGCSPGPASSAGVDALGARAAADCRASPTCATTGSG